VRGNRRTRILKVSRIEPATPFRLARAAGLLRRGCLVALPTETVYGLGGDATRPVAIARIYAAKGRPRFNPLIVHVADLKAARRLARFDQRALALALRFWPGPLTMVLPRRAGCVVPRRVAAGRDTLALRVPSHRVAQRLLRLARCPVAAPSANRSGQVSPTTARHVASERFRHLRAIVDGGAASVGLESTVIDLSGPVARLLRPGAITVADMEPSTGPIAFAEGEIGDQARASPGRLESHYAPALRVRLNAAAPDTNEAFIGFGPMAAVNATAYINLSPRGDLAEAAAGLYAALRSLDRPTYAAIAVAPIPTRGLGAAINDRLKRSAAPRR
jgi:L-threonylcarbamoyladenylate synthase